MRLLNTQYYLFQSEADNMSNTLILKGFATMVERKYSHKYGYWLNVKWKCGETAPLTIQEVEQALEQTDVIPFKNQENNEP